MAEQHQIQHFSSLLPLDRLSIAVKHEIIRGSPFFNWTAKTHWDQLMWNTLLMKGIIHGIDGLPHGSVEPRSWYFVDSKLSTSPVSFKKFQTGTHQQKEIYQFDSRLRIGTKRYRSLGDVSVGTSFHRNRGFISFIFIAVPLVAMTARRSSGSARARSGTLPCGTGGCRVVWLLWK